MNGEILCVLLWLESVQNTFGTFLLCVCLYGFYCIFALFCGIAGILYHIVDKV